LAGTTYYPYSPTRHTLFAELKHNFSRQWRGELRLDYRYSDYGDATIISGVNQGVRSDNRGRYSLIGTWRYSRDTEFEASWRYTDNNSSFTSETYTSNLYQLRANHYF
jgi:outer membrane receptor for ferric coprogen and ferric-rhodotorulic acid